MKSFFIGLQFLTRLKLVNQTEWDIHDFGKSVVTFPLVGLVIGAFMALIYWLYYWLCSSSFLPAAYMRTGSWTPVTAFFQAAIVNVSWKL